MRELIYKDEAVKRLREMVHNPTKDPILLHYERILRQGSEEIQAMPEAVVRCKDCKYYKAYEYTGELACHYVIGGTVVRKLDDFCSRAERREEGEKQWMQAQF